MKGKASGQDFDLGLSYVGERGRVQSHFFYWYSSGHKSLVMVMLEVSVVVAPDLLSSCYWQMQQIHWPFNSTACLDISFRVVSSGF